MTFVEVCWALLIFGRNIFKPNPRVCRRVFPHCCPCGGPDILFENVDDVNQFEFVKWIGVASKCFLIDLLLMSRLFVLQIKTFRTFPRHKVIEIWFYCLFHCSFCNELEFWCPPYDCPSEFFSGSANRLGFHIRRFDQINRMFGYSSDQT